MNKYSAIEAHNNMTCVVSHLSATGLPIDPIKLLAAADEREKAGAAPALARVLRKLALSTSPDGKLHAQWSPGSTGRLYCKPGLQGLPRVARGAVGDGQRVVITGDWKACHLYLMGHLASDEVLLADLDDGAALSRVGDAVGHERAKVAALAYINGAAQDREALDPLFMGEGARYTKSGSWILECRNRALKGVGVSWGDHSLKVAQDKHYSAPGLLLQHVESQAMIDAARSLIKALEPLRGAELALVLHDELLCLSLPGDAPAVKQALSQAMGEGMSTALGIDPAPPVRVKAGWTWGEVSEGELSPPPATPLRALTRAQWAALGLENAQHGSDEVKYGLMVASVDCPSRVALLCSEDPKLRRKVSALSALAQDWTKDNAQAPQVGQDGPVFESGSESELAERMLAVIGSEVIFDGVRFWECGADGFWFESNLLSRICKFDGAAIRGSAMRRVIVSASRARGAVELVKQKLIRLKKYDPNFLDRATKGAVFKDGIIHTSQGEVRKVKPEDRIIRGAKIDVAYDPMASCPRWLAYLGEVWHGAPDCDTRIAYLREWLGAAVWGESTDYRGQPLLVGEAMTGKSVAVKLVQALFAPERRSAVLPSDVCGDNSARHVAALQGKTLNTVDNICTKHLRYVALLNSILSGEQVNARLPRKECFTLQPRAAWLMSMNKLPQVSDMSNSFLSRFVVLSFDRVFTGKGADPKLLDKLKAERAGIIQWAWEGLLNLKTRGFYEEPTSSQAAKREWRKKCDTK